MEIEQSNKPKMIGVHTLSEFVFCPRAGVISHELKNNDPGVDTGFVDLSYSPEYDIVLARQEVGKIRRRLEHFSFGLLGGSLTTVFFGLALKPFLGFLCLLVLLPAAVLLIPWLFSDFKRFLHLKKQLAIYDREIKRLPDLGKLETETIPWYSLLKSCDVEKCHDLLIDKDIGIAGKPWKLLHYNDVCFPVFFCRKPSSATDSEKDPTAWLKRQHSVRMKAYCHLIEKSTGKHSSCGIIVFAGTLDAVAIKFWKNGGAERQLNDALIVARETLVEFEQHDKVGVPAANACARCHLGRPKKYRLEPGTARRNGNFVRPTLHKVATNKESQTLHSVCGDFFQWVPPHEKAKELDLAQPGEFNKETEQEPQPIG